MDSVDRLKNIIKRERAARKAAEQLIEQKSEELYYANQELRTLNESLEDKIIERTREIEASRQELFKAKEIAENATHAKSQFLSNMSHELRTPLNAVIGITYILMGNEPREDQVENLKTLHASAEQLLSLINDILDFSKIESRKIDFEKIPFKVRDALDDVYRVMEFKARQKGIKFWLEVSRDVPVGLLGDTVRYKQVLINLLSNAIKFTQEGGVGVLLSAETDEKGICKLSTQVQDTGIGIAQEKLETIFDSFAQASSNTTRKYGGTGLGLTISKQLVELQNGEIWVESEEGIGTTFSFMIPFEIATINDNGSENNRLPHKDIIDAIAGISILVAEDNLVNQFVIKRFLKKWKINFDIANNGKEALEIVQEKEYDLILMDLHMPVMDGLEATKAIRKLPHDKYKSIPIIALSASAVADIQNYVKKSGMNDFASKPFTPGELTRIIYKYTTQKRDRHSSAGNSLENLPLG